MKTEKTIVNEQTENSVAIQTKGGYRNTRLKNDLLKCVDKLVSEINLSKKGNGRDVLIYKLETTLKNLRLSNGDSIDGFIFKTSDADQFGSVKGNRIINDESSYVKQLADSISEIGNVVPIIVNSKNETIDGQRRLAAIKKYNIETPVRYTRAVDADIDTVGELNRLQFKWTFKDWMHKYVEIGNPDYLRYSELEKKFDKYMRSRSLRSLFMNGRIESFKSKVWENGEFRIDDKILEDNIKFIEFLEKVYEIGGSDNIFARDRNFQRALHDLWKSNSKLDGNRLLKKIRLGFPRLNVRTDSVEYRKIIAELYNSRIRKNSLEINVEEEELADSK